MVERVVQTIEGIVVEPRVTEQLRGAVRRARLAEFELDSRIAGLGLRHRLMPSLAFHHDEHVYVRILVCFTARIRAKQAQLEQTIAERQTQTFGILAQRELQSLRQAPTHG